MNKYFATIDSTSSIPIFIIMVSTPYETPRGHTTRVAALANSIAL